VDKIIRWHPLHGRDKLTSIDTEIDHVDEETGETYYRVWVAGRPEPPGNPAVWSGTTLRHNFEQEKDEKGSG